MPIAAFCLTSCNVSAGIIYNKKGNEGRQKIVLNGNEKCVRKSGRRDGWQTINPKYQNIVTIVDRIRHLNNAVGTELEQCCGYRALILKTLHFAINVG